MAADIAAGAVVEAAHVRQVGEGESKGEKCRCLEEPLVASARLGR